MPIKILPNFKNHRFLRLKPAFLADKTAFFSAKNHRFLREKARNEAVSIFVCFSKSRFYAIQTLQIVAFHFLFR